MSPDKEYLAGQFRKDVPMWQSVVIAVTAVLAAVCGGTASILSSQLSHYRKEPSIGGYWMAGLLFVSPCLTGMTVAYKRRVMTLSSHLGVSVVSTGLGWLASIYAFLAIYTETCTPYPLVGECHKYPLMLLCLTGLVIACVMSLISVITTVFSYKKVLDYQEIINAQRDADDKAAAMKRMRMKARTQRAEENVAMDVKCPDKLPNTDAEQSSYL